MLGASTETTPLCGICDQSEWEASREEARRAALKLPCGERLAAAISSGLCVARQAARLEIGH